MDSRHNQSCIKLEGISLKGGVFITTSTRPLAATDKSCCNVKLNSSMDEKHDHLANSNTV